MDVRRLMPEVRGNPACHGSRVFPKERWGQQWVALSPRWPNTKHSANLWPNRLRMYERPALIKFDSPLKM